MRLAHAVVIWELIAKHNYQSLVEIGVLEGSFTRQILRDCDIHRAGQLEAYYLIDPWQAYDSMPNAPEGFWEQAHRAALELAEQYDIIKVMRAPSIEAVGHFIDHSVDLVFIDGHHGYTYVMDDIAAWLPKVAKGGILAGHDYLKNTPAEAEGTWGVHRAVNECFSSELIHEEPGAVWWVYADAT